MKVLAICAEDPGDILGGMGVHVRELYRVLAAQGVEIDLLTQGSREGSEDYLGFTKHYDDKHICFKPRKPDMACRFMVDIQMAKTLTKLIAERGGDYWDVIHGHEWTSVQLARIARRALSLPLVNTMHLCLSKLAMIENPKTSPASWGEADQYMMQQEGNLVCDPDEFILCSNSYVDTIRNHFMTERPINMIYNGIDTTTWHLGAGHGNRCYYFNELDYLRSSDSVQPKRPIALFVGRIAEMKGIKYLLDAVEAKDTGWQVVLAGEVNANNNEDKEAWDVTKRIRALELKYPERLRWIGFLQGNDLLDAYDMADVVLMPSTHEPFGIVALEAMSMGVPLISTEVDGLGEIVTDDDEEFALIIPPRSPESIIAALKVLKSPDVRSELRAAGLRRVKDFTWEKATEKTLAVYDRALRYGAQRVRGENQCQQL